MQLRKKRKTIKRKLNMATEIFMPVIQSRVRNENTEHWGVKVYSALWQLIEKSCTINHSLLRQIQIRRSEAGDEERARTLC